MQTQNALLELDPDDRELFNSDPDEWGSAKDAVSRGSRFLDRVEPGWFEVVDVFTLAMSSSCNCVLGQLFTPVFNTEYAGVRTSPFSVGIDRLKITGEVEKEYDSYDGACYTINFKLSEFLGFDITEGSNTFDYHQLGKEWREQIALRQDPYCE